MAIPEVKSETKVIVEVVYSQNFNASCKVVDCSVYCYGRRVFRRVDRNYFVGTRFD